MAGTSRRGFLQTSAVTGAAAFAAPAIVARAAGANERIRVALVGLGGRMSSHIGSLAVMKDEVDLVAVCDCDDDKLSTAEKRYPDLAGKKLKVFKDQRALFDDKEIDAVSFSTQDHWHALQTIWACQAGKHVYVEKPPTWCISEGRKMVEAARKYKRMVQIGTQNRSSPNVVEGMRKLKEGAIGKLYMGRGMTYKMRGNMGKHRPRAVPKGLNWDQWIGPARMVDYSSFHHRHWYWISNFASGDVANQTVHDVDKLRWGLELNTHPTTVMSLGGRYVPAEDDDADTTNTQAFLCQWAGRNILFSFEFRHWYTNSEAQMRDKYPFVAENQCVGEIFFGSEGYMIFPDYSSYYTFLGPKNEPGPFKTAGPGIDWRNESVPHFRNWTGAIRSGKHEDLNADVEQGHLSCSVCHLAKISAKLGRSVHLDPNSERFVNDPEADKFLTREYRKPYVVPDQV
jgi:predicted dehydrogenase